MTDRRSEKIFYALTDVNDEFVYEAMKFENSITISKRMRLIPIVACLVMLISGASIFAFTDLGTYLIESFTSRTEMGSDYSESGFDLEIDIDKVPVTSLSNEIQEVSDIIIQQFESTSIFSSWYPGHWQEKFESLSEAIDFIGYDKLVDINWNYAEEQVLLNVMGNEKGEILSVRLETWYLLDDIRLQSTLYLETEYSEDSPEYNLRSTESIEFKESFYSVNEHVKCHIITSSPLESGYLTMNGFLVKEDILYNLHVSFKAPDEKKAKELLHSWANLFK